MHISDEDIKEFQKLYKQRYKKEISREKACEQGLKLLLLLKRIYKPMTEGQFERIQQHRTGTFSGWIRKIMEDGEK
jgi:hypothetical protein